MYEVSKDKCIKKREKWEAESACIGFCIGQESENAPTTNQTHQKNDSGMAAHQKTLNETEDSGSSLLW